jgi:HK97 family phage major capsid protein
MRGASALAGGRLIRVTNEASAEMVLIQNAIKEMDGTLKKRDGEIATALTKAQDEIKAFGVISTETKNQLAKLATDGTAVQSRLLDLEQKFANFKPANDNKLGIVSPGKSFVEDKDVKNFLAQQGRHRGRITWATNAITSISTGDGGAGDLIRPDRVPGIVEARYRKLTIRDLLPVGRTSSNSVEFVQETGFTNNAAPVAEGAQKPESSLSFDLQTAAVRTIAHIMKASVQILADVPQLQSFIDTRLRTGLGIVEEDQFLSGDGTGQNLLGLIPQATAFDTALLAVGDTRIDVIRKAMYQVELAVYNSTAIVMHPRDWMLIELTKESGTGAYVWANPRGLISPTLWGLPVVTSAALEEGEFLVGAFDVAAQIWDRQQATIDVATENRDDFEKNMVTIRGEERVALTVYRPESFVYGDFDTTVSS